MGKKAWRGGSVLTEVNANASQASAQHEFTYRIFCITASRLKAKSPGFYQIFAILPVKL
jgi:hypothetical protein